MVDYGLLETIAETRILLGTCCQENILVWVTQNDVVFADVVEELGQQRFHRSMQQCHAKLKALKNVIRLSQSGPEEVI